MSKASAARNERRQAKAAAPKPDLPPPQAQARPQGVGRQFDMAFMQTVQRMIAGEAPAPNKYVSYQLGKLRTAQSEYDGLMRNIQQGEAQLAQMRTAANQADGHVQAHLSDIQAWLDEEDAAPQHDLPTASDDDSAACAAAPLQ